MSFMPQLDYRSRHLAAGVLGIMIREDFEDGLSSSMVSWSIDLAASRIWELSGRHVGYAVIVDTLIALMNLGYVRRDPHEAASESFRLQRGIRAAVEDWHEFYSPKTIFPDPLFKFYRYVAPASLRERESILKTGGVMLPGVGLARVVMVEVSPFSENRICMLFRHGGPGDQEQADGPRILGLTPEVMERMASGYRDFESRPEGGRGRCPESFRLDVPHDGMSLEMLKRLAERENICDFLALCNPVEKIALGQRDASNGRVIDLCSAFSRMVESVQCDMAEDRRQSLRQSNT